MIEYKVKVKLLKVATNMNGHWCLQTLDWTPATLVGAEGFEQVGFSLIGPAGISLEWSCRTLTIAVNIRSLKC